MGFKFFGAVAAVKRPSRDSGQWKGSLLIPQLGLASGQWVLTKMLLWPMGFPQMLLRPMGSKFFGAVAAVKRPSKDSGQWKGSLLIPQLGFASGQWVLPKMLLWPVGFAQNFALANGF